jgi:hypothetical protein
MNTLGVTIQRQPFAHLFYHFVLTYSNWETGSICFSESFESLSFGLQSALWELGGVPLEHRSDRLSAALNNKAIGEPYTKRYEALLNHYKLTGQKTQPRKPNENGDIEQRHNRLKRAIDQALMLRGSRDFESREDYERFLRKLIDQLNSGRNVRLQEELRVVRNLPARRLDDFKILHATVGQGSTIRVNHNTYSVHSRLLGEDVEVRLHAEFLDVFYAQRRVHRIERLHGRNKHRIDYRHVIDWLVRKPGAFANYRYRSELFPTSRFRMAYDQLCKQNARHADKHYLRLLSLATHDGESAVDQALNTLFGEDRTINADAVKEVLGAKEAGEVAIESLVEEVDLMSYDALLTLEEVL